MRSLKARLGLAVVGGLSTALLYAEGVLVNGWIEVVLLFPVIGFLFPTRADGLLQNTLLALTALCLTLTVSDLCLRPFMGPRLQSSPMNLFTRKLPELPLLGRWDPHVRFSGETYGDLAAMVGDPGLREPHQIVFQTDAAGFRNDSVPAQVDLVVLGDSFGAWAGVTQDKMVSHLLARRLGVRTYNLSFPASGPWQQYVNFAIESPRLVFAPGARLMWLLYTGNDLDDDYGDTWRIEELPWRSGFNAWRVRYKTFRGRSPLHQLLDHLGWRMTRRRTMAENVLKMELPDGRPMLFLKAQEEWPWRSESEVREHYNFSNLTRTLEAMKDLADRRDVRLSVVVLPTKGEVYPWILKRRPPTPDDARSSGFFQAVQSACEDLGLTCADAKPHFVREAQRLFSSTGDLLWWRDDTHLNERGHEVLAEFLAREALGRATRSGQESGNARCRDTPC